MSLKRALDGAAAGLGRLRSGVSRSAGELGRLQQSSATASSAVGRLKTSAGQVEPSLNRMKSGADRAHGSLGRLHTAATRSGGGLRSLRTAVTQADGGFGKARGGADKLKSALDKLKKSADNTRNALRDVKRQADAVEKSVGKAGKGADRTGKSMGGLGKGLKGATGAQKGLNVAMKANVLGLVVGLLAPLISQFVNMDKVVAVAKKGFEIAWRAIRSATDSAMKFLGPLLKGVVNLFTAPIRGLINAMNGAIGGLNRIKVDIPSWVPVFGGKSFGINLPKLPNIPALAEGGIVPARHGGRLALLAEAGEAEAVIPLSKLDTLLRTGSLRGRGRGPGGQPGFHIENYYESSSGSARQTAEALMFLAKARG
ncbi:hypothetical protein [Streptomyces sp. URMC 123]|uniref:hypothetical protein n=1 Tax=Streptomyces sp. URMC 123 TaxID=3423403 RepID=UPI003F1C1918